MQIEERKSDDELNIKISGRLDTNTAPQLEQYVNDNFFGSFSHFWEEDRILRYFCFLVGVYL